MLKRPKLPRSFQGRVFKGKFSGAGQQMHVFLLKASGVVTGRLGNFVLSLKLSSSTWVRALVPIEELKDLYQIIMHIHWGGARTLLYTCTIVS